ncbi:MAG: YicC/YloC family endoribonuclease [Pseudomonadota bacterium]
MTGFAETSGADDRLSWRWEARAVNGRGLDLRFRLPEGAEALEAPLRKTAQSLFRRGTLTLSLRLSRPSGQPGSQLNETALHAGLVALARSAALAKAQGVALAPLTADRLLALPGVYAQESDDVLPGARLKAVQASGMTVLERLATARAGEGAAMHALLEAQLAQIERLVVDARGSAEARSAHSGVLLRSRVEALLGTGAAVDPDRLAQELAQIAVRADVTEELDRLDAHIQAAKKLVDSQEAVGRKLDFLAQEFHREANTLCAKSGTSDLTAIGLSLKVVIDQMREQVQNVE